MPVAIEFKQALPTRDGGPDRWVSHGDRIGDRARDEIIREVVGFANAFGGTLVIGVAESEDDPRRAADVIPLPRCADLAVRLALQCRDGIEPTLAALDVRGVVTHPDGGGVVVLQVGKSRMAPHRSRYDLQCYARRANRTEAMTMREIQDHSLNVNRGMARVEAELRKRADSFEEALGAFRGVDQVYGIRVTLVALDPIYVDQLVGNATLRPICDEFEGMFPNGDRCRLFVPGNPVGETAILGGARSTGGNQDYRIERCLGRDGLVEYTVFLRCVDPRVWKLFPGWFVALVANGIVTAERMRRAANALGAEFVLDVELFVHGDRLPIAPYGDRSPMTLGHIDARRHRFPRYGVRGTANFSDLCGSLERDLWNASGRDWPYRIAVGFEQLQRPDGIDGN